MTSPTYDLPSIYFCPKLKLGTKYMIGFTRRHFMLIHIFCVREVFMTTSFIHNICTFNRIGNVRKGVLPILTLVTLKQLKESTYDSCMMFIYL